MMLFLNEGSAKLFSRLIVFVVVFGFLIATSVLVDKVADAEDPSPQPGFVPNALFSSL